MDGEDKGGVKSPKMREHTLNQFKHIRTCILARELCLLLRTNGAAFSVEDTREHCAFIAKLCDEASCKEQSDLCSKAAETVLTSEEKYLELCEQSSMKCGESRRTAPERTAYVA